MGLYNPFGYLKHKLWLKKGLGVNWQFDSRPLKVWNRPNLLAWRWHAIYRWKILDNGYNFALNLTSIRGLHRKLWTSKFGVPILRISGLLTWESQDKMTLGIGLVARHKEDYKGEGDGFPQVRVVMSLMSLCLLVHQKCSNYALTNLLFGLCRPVWIIDRLVTCPSPHPKAPARPSTPKVLWAKECTPTLYPFIVLSLNL